MRDNTNYMETALLTGLQQTSMFPQAVLENFYKKSRDAVSEARCARLTPLSFPAVSPT